MCGFFEVGEASTETNIYVNIDDRDCFCDSVILTHLKG